jgi:oligopeptide transport system ATP-binding protein
MTAVPEDSAAPAAAPARASRDGGGDLLEVTNLVKHFPIKSGILIDRQVGAVRAVDDVSFGVREGETLGLVGESGCGKSTLCRTMVQLLEPTSGSVKFEGKEIAGLGRRALQPLRRQMQMIFQDPYASLNPRKRVGQIVGDPLKLHGVASGGQLKRQVQELLERVGLSPEHYNRFPHEFSGGQRQRIGIARALALRPRLVIADEPVSALDVSIQAQIINLLDDLQDEFKLTYVFVAHDLGVVRHVADRVAVMYLGKIVELGPADDVYANPVHPYTVSLLSAVPIPDPRENREREHVVLEGDVPSPANPPAACRFHTRCPRATEICSEVEPELIEHRRGHWAACHHPHNVGAGDPAGVATAAQ